MEIEEDMISLGNFAVQKSELLSFFLKKRKEGLHNNSKLTKQFLFTSVGAGFREE